MLVIAYIVVGFAILQLFVVLANTVFTIVLPESTSVSNTVLLSVLIPARNESNRIGNLLNDLIHQDYQNLEIIVFNDQSTDNTEATVNQYIQKDNKIRLINSDGLPHGWLGKNHACHSLANVAKGQYLLFLDADVRVGKGLINNSLNYLLKYRLTLLSIFPYQMLGSNGERATVPVMNYILLSLLPLVLVRTSKYPSLSAANGQFMLFDASTYRVFQPHNIFKNNKVEDIAIARYYKNQGKAIGCLVGNESIRCRMYSGFNEAVNGFSKNVTAFFGQSFVVAFFFWLVTTLGFLVVWQTLPIMFLIMHLFIIVITRILVSLTSKQNWINNLLFLIPQQLALGVFIYKAFINKRKEEYVWKGRKIS